jgi:polysaccharide biosynthesis/export protein
MLINQTAIEQKRLEMLYSLPEWRKGLQTALIFGCVLSLMGGAKAQSDAQTPTASTTQQLIGSSPSLDTNKDNKAFSPAKIFGKPNSSGVNYDLKERPAGKPAPTVLNTLVETKVENKTTNQIGGGDGGGGSNRADPGAAVAAAGGFSSTYDFPSLVRNSVGSNLPFFGSTYTAGDAQKLNALDPLTVPLDYRVGPGDELLIRAWGQIDIDFQGQIDRSGMIFLTRIGSIMVDGRKLTDLPAFFKTVIGRQYKNFEVTVSLGSMRQIQYYLTGFARQVGVHSTESIATALHGLVAGGGALPEGDLRRIELRRAGQAVMIIDAYQLLAEGNKSEDPQLQPGDILHIPAAQGFFAVAGNVRRPAIYHLADGMTVADALRLAGGVALGQQAASIRREQLKSDPNNGQSRRLDVFDPSSPQMQNPLKDGDLLMVLPVSPRFDTAVTLRGNVAQPLRQAHTPGMKISDLLNPATAFIRPSVWMERNGRSSLDGLGRGSREVDFTVEFPDVNWEYAAIERFDRERQAMQLVPFHLGKALKKDAKHDLGLMPGDTVVIFAKQDFRQPEAEFLRLVKVEGEVRSPGLYPIRPGETLKDMIERAGGLTDRSYVFGTILSRQTARKTESGMLKEAADRIEQDYLRYLASKSRNATSADEASIGYPELEAIKTLVNKLRTAEPEGRVALNLKNAEAKFDEFPVLALEDQDRIIIPAKPSTVTVTGAVFRQGTLLWSPSASVNSYVANSGGVRQYADTTGFVIFRADGTVRNVTSAWYASGMETLNPGDAIMVPEDVQSSGWTRLFRDWSQIFYQLGLGTAALKVLGGAL